MRSRDTSFPNLLKEIEMLKFFAMCFAVALIISAVVTILTGSQLIGIMVGYVAGGAYYCLDIKGRCLAQIEMALLIRKLFE